MKIRLNENGWTVFVEDLDIKEITQDQVNIVARYLLTNNTVIFKKQKLTPDDEIRICSMFGDVLIFDKFYDALLVKDGHRKINRVTGELDEHGRPGLFGHVTELEWHCNRVSDPDRKPIVFLYGEKGTVGSRTSWLNHILTYNDLPQEKKDQFKDIKLNVGNVQQYITNYGTYEPQDISHYRPNLVHTNPLGVTSLFFSWRQTHFIEDMSNEDSRKFIEELREFCEQEKYIYHHDWDDGDVILADQWSGIHKRCEFAGMDKRVLHRLVFDYENVDMKAIKKSLNNQ